VACGIQATAIIIEFFHVDATFAPITVLGIKWFDSQNDRTGCNPAIKNKKYNFRFRPIV